MLDMDLKSLHINRLSAFEFYLSSYFVTPGRPVGRSYISRIVFRAAVLQPKPAGCGLT
jgi:hypothetical protein